MCSYVRTHTHVQQYLSAHSVIPPYYVNSENSEISMFSSMLNSKRPLKIISELFFPNHYKNQT